MAKVKVSMEEWHNVVKSLNKLLHLLYDALKERDAYKKQRDELINDMAEVKKKAKAFGENDDLITGGTLKDREPNAIFQNICHVIINTKESDHEG